MNWDSFKEYSYFYATSSNRQTERAEGLINKAALDNKMSMYTARDIASSRSV